MATGLQPGRLKGYDLLVRDLASREFGGDEKAARARADDALIEYALGRLCGETTTSRHGAIDSILDGAADLPGAVCETLDRSCSLIMGTASRDAGAVCTPPPVARYICRRTIESHLLGQMASAAGKKYGSIEGLIGGPAQDRSRAAAILDGLRLLDSTCGTGIFLEAALQEMCRLKLALDRPGHDDVHASLVAREVLSNNIYGLDIDEYSLKVARARLMLRLAAMGYDDLRSLVMKLAPGNALLADVNPGSGRGFDVIVGNPPYMRVKSMFKGSEAGSRKAMKSGFARELVSSGLYRCQEGNLNLYKLFIERNLSLLKDGGSMGLIFPSPFLNEATSTKLRRHIFDTCAVEEIVEAPERSRLFDGVNQAAAIMICHKAGGTGQLLLRTGAGLDSLDKGGSSICIRLDELSDMTNGRMEVPLLSAPGPEWAMLRLLRRIPPFAGDGDYMPVGEVSVGNVDETIDKEFISSEPTGHIFVKGIHLKEYAVDLSPGGRQPRWVRKDEFLAKRPSAKRAVSLPRIIGRNTLNKACRRRLKFAPLPPGYLCGNSIKQITITDGSIDPLYLLALLNSSVLNWRFEVFCAQNNIRNYSIEALPIPRAPGQVQQAFACVAGLILEAGEREREFLDRRLMDAMAYELYFTEMRTLSSAVLSAMDEGASPAGLARREDINAIIDIIAGRESFRIVQRATYRL